MAQAADETVDAEVQDTPLTETQDLPQTGNEPGEEVKEPEGEEVQDEGVVVTIEGGESPSSAEEEAAPEWVRELRKSNREKDFRLRKQEEEIARLKGAGKQPAAVVVGDEPTFEDCLFVEADFKRKWHAWNQRKQDHAAQEAQKAETQQKQQDAWQAKLANYGKAKAALKVKDYEDAEAQATSTLSVVQQGVILNGAENPAVLVYALGKNPAKAKELAAIDDPVKFAFAVAKLETQLKVTPRKSVPPPERVVRSSVAGAAAVDNVLEKLREEARKTGDLSKVVAYKRDRKQAGRG